MGNLKKTSLNKKIFVYFCLQTLIVLIVVNFFGYYSITNNIINLHLKRNKEELIRIVNQIDNEKSTVQHILKDYSSWNNAVDYVNYKRNNENAMYCLDFEKSELSGTAIDQIGREIVMVIDNNKEVLYELNKNGLGSEKMNIPIEIKNYAFSDGLIESLDHVHYKNGIINTEQGIFFMGIYPILNNRGEGEKNGAMVMAKEIQIDNLKKYLPGFTMKAIGNINEDTENRTKIVETNSIGSVDVEVFKKGIVNNEISAKAYIKDITGNNMFEIGLENTGVNLKYNITSLTLLFILIFILYITIMFCTWKFFNENFISRVQNILTSLKNINDEIVITSVESQLCSKDELDIVENNINLMMEKIESHYDEILEMEKKLNEDD